MTLHLDGSKSRKLEMVLRKLITVEWICFSVLSTGSSSGTVIYLALCCSDKSWVINAIEWPFLFCSQSCNDAEIIEATSDDKLIMNVEQSMERELVG
jgi:hypothetical protein